MQSIHLKPVYSCPAEHLPSSVVLPDGWTSLAWHQIETFKALNEPKIDVIFNTAMTGDGKSLAAYFKSFQEYYCALGLYPTNALAGDQENQLLENIQRFEPSHRPRVNRLSSAELEIYAETEGLKKADAISTRTSQSEVIVTNPDIFHYIYRGAYINAKEAPDKLWSRIDRNFDLFIFDEFHIFAAPQVASVINTMLLIRATNRQKKFLFLSATPDEEMLTRLTTAGFRCKVIAPHEENKYQFPDSDREKADLEANNWRQISRAITLNFVSVEAGASSSEGWIKEHSEEILTRFQLHPGTKGAVILNSIASVKRLVPFLQALFEPYGLSVGENTGLSGQEKRARSLEADLVVGTSTIDVGVDFKINFLIFESADAGNFIQRLGRLGRHDGYERDRHQVAFDEFQAYALIPKFFAERLFAGEEPPLIEQHTYDRSFLHETIRANYRSINDFRSYYSRWGAYQSLAIATRLQHKTIKQQYTGSLDSFSENCEKVFGQKLRSLFGRVKGWEADWKALSGQKNGNPIYEDACSFRGSSPLQCGLYDLTEENPADRYKTYGLPGVLSNLEVEVWTKAEFLRSLEETAKATGQPIPKGRFEHCLIFLKLRAYREERLNWKFNHAESLATHTHQVKVLTGLEIWQPDNPWASDLNNKLKRQGIVSYVVAQTVPDIRYQLRLPMHFQIYPISDQSSYHDAVPPYSVAFGQSALLIDTLGYQLKQSRGDPLIF
ncbi:MAG: type I-D CRISPR-associated helicase Cas3' [Phormidesmis sp. RL_2_1]|nr:type I-D CRISPR-associated helicase Cas3' [Phormidesmis sp. RL_2_1]